MREETWTLNEPLPKSDWHLGIPVFKVSLWYPSNVNSIPALRILLAFWVRPNLSILEFWVPPNLRISTFWYHPNLSFSHFVCLPESNLVLVIFNDMEIQIWKSELKSGM